MLIITDSICVVTPNDSGESVKNLDRHEVFSLDKICVRQ
jgi:hypothetical protein